MKLETIQKRKEKKRVQATLSTTTLGKLHRKEKNKRQH